MGRHSTISCPLCSGLFPAIRLRPVWRRAAGESDKQPSFETGDHQNTPNFSVLAWIVMGLDPSLIRRSLKFGNPQEKPNFSSIFIRSKIWENFVAMTSSWFTWSIMFSFYALVRSIVKLIPSFTDKSANWPRQFINSGQRRVMANASWEKTAGETINGKRQQLTSFFDNWPLLAFSWGSHLPTHNQNNLYQYEGK